MQEQEIQLPVQAGTGHQTKGDRFSSFQVEDFEIPHGRDEDWRFTPLRSLRGLHDGTAASGVLTKVAVEIPEKSPQISTEILEPGDARLGRAGAPVDRAAAQAWTSMKAARYIHIPAETVSSEPIMVTVTGSGEDVTSYGALVVEVEHHAEAILILHYQGNGTHSDNHEFIIGDGAKLTVVVIEDWGSEAVHLSNSHIQLGRDATIHHTYACFGGKVVRSVPHVRYTAPGGDADMLGVYFADDGQYFEQRLLVDHSVPQCRSNVLYKGALQSRGEHEARTAWIGDVLIRPDATGTDTYETNKNLVLTPGARADSVPNLEIQTGEIVGAGHAATVGRFDDEHMFYLQSRGIPKEVAKRLIVRGFFSDVINRIPVESTRNLLEEHISRELENTVL